MNVIENILNFIQVDSRKIINEIFITSQSNSRYGEGRLSAFGDIIEIINKHNEGDRM